MTIIYYYKAGVLRSSTGTLELSKQNQLGLELFCQKAGMLVTKDEFMQVCWGNKGVIVSDNTVRQSLFRLRTSLAEVGAPEDTLITQGRNGYILKPGIIKLSDSENIYDIIANDSSDEETLSENNHPTITAELFKQDKNLNEKATDAIKQPAVKNKIMRYTLSGIAIFLSFAAGLYLRFIFLTPNISFAHYKNESGRDFFFSDTIRKDKSKENAVKRISYWLDINNISPAERPLIYVSADWRDTLSFFSCKNKLSLQSSDCLSINVIGDNKK